MKSRVALTTISRLELQAPVLGSRLDSTVGKVKLHTIYLTSFVLKTLERLVDRYAREGIEDKGGRHTNQSIESALHKLFRRIDFEKRFLL